MPSPTRFFFPLSPVGSKDLIKRVSKTRMNLFGLLHRQYEKNLTPEKLSFVFACEEEIILHLRETGHFLVHNLLVLLKSK